MDLKLEVLVLPVSDVDRAKRFYEKLGFRLDIDYAPNEDYRVVQMTPPGSQASIIFGKGVTAAKPGSIDRLLMAVYDIEAARNELVSHGVEVSEIFHDADGGLGGGFHAGANSRAPGRDPQGRSYGSYASLNDPDGNVTESSNGKVTSILLDALKSAATAHGAHEKELGKADPDWPQWYAEHMTRTLTDTGYHITGP